MAEIRLSEGNRAVGGAAEHRAKSPNPQTKEEKLRAY